MVDNDRNSRAMLKFIAKHYERRVNFLADIYTPQDVN